MKVTHIITGLNPDGAETMMANLICHMNSNRFRNEVISLAGMGAIGTRLINAGIPVRALELTNNRLDVSKLARLVKWLRTSKPDVIQTWMYHGDLLGGLAARLARNVPVIWGVHHSDLEADSNKRSVLRVARACARLSRVLPARIVFCSVASKSAHTRFGYAEEKAEVIPNGFDVSRFRPNPSARERIRHELGVPPDTVLVGMAARYHPHKDHANFIAAACETHREFPGVHYVLFGSDITWSNPDLSTAARDAGLADRIHLLGPRSDVPDLFAAMDIVTSSSRTEAFPLAIGEAMACNIPCVVTDVGDSGLMVMDTGVVVPPRDASALASGWSRLIAAGREARMNAGSAARNRIQQSFSLPSIVARYEDLYATVAG
jgi:glycosyltransferase involved in cell wall biosynthesis